MSAGALFDAKYGNDARFTEAKIKIGHEAVLTAAKLGNKAVTTDAEIKKIILPEVEVVATIETPKIGSEFHQVRAHHPSNDLIPVFLRNSWQFIAG